jgi:hypothetical protein
MKAKQPNVNNPRSDDLSFQHLQAELLRIDLLIRRQVLCWQKAGQDPRDAFRGLYIADSEAALLLEHPLGANWGQFGLLTLEEEAWFTEMLEKASERASSISEKARLSGQPLRLETLVDRFGWDSFDRDTFLVCSAPCLDLKYERLYGYLQDDVTRKRPTVNLILDLLCSTGAERLDALTHFSPDSPLFRDRFLEKVQDFGSKSPLLSQPLVVDESVVSWLLGQYQARPEMTRVLKLAFPGDEKKKNKPVPQEEPPEDALLDTQVRVELEKLEEPEPIAVFFGSDRLSQEVAGRLLASRRGVSLLSLDLETVGQDNFDGIAEFLELALRDARMLESGLSSRVEVCLG